MGLPCKHHPSPAPPPPPSLPPCVPACLQSELIHTLLLAGEVMLAQEYCHMFGLDPGALSIDEQLLEQERLRRAEAFLQLSLSPSNLHFVDTPAGLAAMSLALQEQLRLPPQEGRAGGSSSFGGSLDCSQSADGGGDGLGAEGTLPADGHLHGGGSGGGSSRLGQHASSSRSEGGGSGKRGVHNWAGAGGALPVVGVDVEWKPERTDGVGGSSPASLLQVSRKPLLLLVVAAGLIAGLTAGLTAGPAACCFSAPAAAMAPHQQHKDQASPGWLHPSIQGLSAACVLTPALHCAHPPADCHRQ